MDGSVRAVLPRWEYKKGKNKSRDLFPAVASVILWSTDRALLKFSSKKEKKRMNRTAGNDPLSYKKKRQQLEVVRWSVQPFQKCANNASPTIDIHNSFKVLISGISPTGGDDKK